MTAPVTAPNPVLILARNCLALTARAIASVRAQDIPTTVLVIDNDSTDGTAAWCNEHGVLRATFRPQLGVSAGWNFGLRQLFRNADAAHVLVLNNDVALPRWFYRRLLACGLPFATGNETTGFDPALALEPPALSPPVPHPDFSAFLITRACYEQVGPFDEDMRFYASDNDYHIRAHRLGVPLMNCAVPYLHDRSSTLRNADPLERDCIERQADADRLMLHAKWGVTPGTPEYAELFR